MQSDSTVLIIGAGACGLMAARTLSAAGCPVSILEGRDRCGGRIHTLDQSIFSFPAETGAEFIHGNLPVTMQLLKEAGIAYTQVEGRSYSKSGEGLHSGQSFIEGWPMLMEKLQSLKEDISIAAFLNKFFEEEKYSGLRKSLIAFVEGYDAADPERASALALRDEWSMDDDHEQYRIQGGYSLMIDFLEKKCVEKGVKIQFNTCVNEIAWKRNAVQVKAGTQTFTGSKLLLTVPLGVLQAGDISFSPPLTEKTQAVMEMGFGAVIKILLGFREKFWEKLQDVKGKGLHELGFLFSSEQVPTWWTQYPDSSPLLTGWLAGPKAKKMANASEEELLVQALSSLSTILGIPAAGLRSQLKAYKIINWTADPFTKGAYGYATVESNQLRKILATPDSDTIYFGGEALYEGPEVGTVEAALANGEKRANEILKNLRIDY